MKILSLIIKQVYFDQIMKGEKTQEFREVTLRTEKKYIQLDDEGYQLEDEEGYPIPVHYDAIRFYVGYAKDRDTALVEVTGETTNYFVDDNDKIIEWQLENGDWWSASEVVFDLGKILEKKWTHGSAPKE